jgi:hypothetical protein
VPEIRRQDADHSEGHGVDRDRAANHRGIGAEPPAPQPIAQHRDARGARPIVLGQKQPAELWAHPERREEAIGDLHRTDALSLAGAAADGGQANPPVRTHLLERRTVAPKVEEVRRREVAGGAQVLLPADDLHQPVGVRILEGPEQHGLYDAENRRRRADAERQGDDGHGSKAGPFRQTAEGVAKVLKQHVG